jgi:putative flippase GtrA
MRSNIFVFLEKDCIWIQNQLRRFQIFQFICLGSVSVLCYILCSNVLLHIFGHSERPV